MRPKGGSLGQEEGPSWASRGGAGAVLVGRRLCCGDGRGSRVGCDWDSSWEGPVTPGPTRDGQAAAGVLPRGGSGCVEVAGAPRP